MPNYEFAAESPFYGYPVITYERRVRNVIIVRMIGPMEAMQEATNMYTDHFPIDRYDTDTLGNARLIETTGGVEIYELFLVRGVDPLKEGVYVES